MASPVLGAEHTVGHSPCPPLSPSPSAPGREKLLLAPGPEVWRQAAWPWAQGEGGLCARQGCGAAGVSRQGPRQVRELGSSRQECSTPQRPQTLFSSLEPVVSAALPGVVALQGVPALLGLQQLVRWLWEVLGDRTVTWLGAIWDHPCL